MPKCGPLTEVTIVRYSSVPVITHVSENVPLSNPSVKGMVATPATASVAARCWEAPDTRFENTTASLYWPPARPSAIVLIQTVTDDVAPASRTPPVVDSDNQDAFVSVDQLRDSAVVFDTAYVMQSGSNGPPSQPLEVNDAWGDILRSN